MFGALLHYRKMEVTDNIVKIFLKLIRKVERKAIKTLEQKVVKDIKKGGKPRTWTCHLLE